MYKVLTDSCNELERKAEGMMGLAHCGNMHNWPFRHGKRRSQHMEKEVRLSHVLQTVFPTASWAASYTHSHECRRIRNMGGGTPFPLVTPLRFLILNEACAS